MSQPLVNIRTIEDLNKILFMQRSITRRAKEELLAVASDAILDPTNIEQVEKLMRDEGELLEKYANYPTLTEFNLMPNLEGGTKWGATFGVTLLVGELILEQVKAIQGTFESVLRPMLVLLLAELDSPQHDFLVEPLEKSLHMTVTSNSGRDVTEEERQVFVRKLVSELVKAFIHVCSTYGVVKEVEEGYQITSRGKRILLHLIDAQKFILDIVDAHARFQSNKPKLSMT
jgi:hypothetical protein